MAARVKLSEAQIKRLVSHREPFLLLSYAVENIIGKRVRVVSRQQSTDALTNRMHILEGLGQTTALLVRQMEEYKHSGLPVIAAMRNIHWTDYNDKHDTGTLTFSAELNRALHSRFVIADAVARVGDVEVCAGQLVASFQTPNEAKRS